MSRKGLESIIEIRKQSVDAAQHALARGLMAESGAAEILASAERVIVTEQHAASAIATSDEVVEAFARWLTVARQRVEAARHASDHAQAESGRLRALLTASRTALETVQTLAAEREADRAAHQARRDARELEECYRPAPQGSAMF